MSSKSLQEKLVPESLTSQKVLVVTKIEDPEVLKERQKTIQSKSVSELSQITSFSDLPVPSRIEKSIRDIPLPGLWKEREGTTSLSRKEVPTKKLKRSTSGEAVSKPKDYSHLSPMAIHDTIYSTLPRSMKSELKVSGKYFASNFFKMMPFGFYHFSSC